MKPALLESDHRWVDEYRYSSPELELSPIPAFLPPVVESVKAASDIYSPISGEVIAINQAVADSPEAINDDPYGQWLYKLNPSDVSELEGLLDSTAYTSEIGE